jgi:hypothetical protein
VGFGLGGPKKFAIWPFGGGRGRFAFGLPFLSSIQYFNKQAHSMLLIPTAHRLGVQEGIDKLLLGIRNSATTQREGLDRIVWITELVMISLI